MKSLGETYKQGSGTNRASGQHNSQSTSRSSEQSVRPISGRDTFCTGDIIATLIGTAVLGLGVLLWVSPEMGLFSNDIVGIRRLAELTTSLGINATVLRGLLIYSLIKETPEREDHSLADDDSPQPAESLSDFKSFRLCAFVIP